MVDAEGIEIQAHLREALFPPRETIGFHTRPIVGRKAPVLALFGKIIGRRACLTAHIIQFGRYPGIAAVAVNADWNIAFNRKSFFMCISRGGTQLQVQVPLNEEMNGDGIVVFGLGIEQFFQCFCIKYLMGFPAAEIGGAVFIAQVTESGIRRQPVFIFSIILLPGLVLLPFCLHGGV
jgi:hypothetical protein